MRPARFRKQSTKCAAERGLTDTHNLFVPKGQWVFGGTASYSTHTNDNYKFLVVDGIDSKATPSAPAP